jgi:hypothetical protein
MTTNDIAKRLSAIERELAQLKDQSILQAAKLHPVHALERIHGSFENDDAFQEAMRLGRKWRNADGTAKKPKAKRK